MTGFHSMVRLVAAALALTVAPLAVQAQTYPSKPVKIIVGYPPGGSTDILARLLADRLTASLDKPVIVENKPGAGGNIGADFVAKSPADGHTLMMGTAGNMTINPSIYPKMPVDTVKDFAPISLMASMPNLMVVNPKVPAKTVQEFVAWARSQPKGSVFFASSGNGNSPHMTGELFNLAAQLQMVHVPYKGSGPALADLIAGQSHVMFDNMVSAIGHARSGALRALAVTTAERVESEPNLPTVAESGYPGFQVVAWFGLFAPAGTPEPIVNRLAKEMAEILRVPAVKKRLMELGANPSPTTPAEFAALVKSDIAKWAKVVEAAKIQAP